MIGSNSFDLQTLPGIMRDNPLGNVDSFTNGDMVRIYGMGMRKMGGWEKIFGDSDIIRELYATSINGNIRLFAFSNRRIKQIDFNRETYEIISLVDRTPVNWHIPTVDEGDFNFSITGWTILVDLPGGESIQVPYLFFVGLPTANDPSSEVEKIIFQGRIDLNTPFEELINSEDGFPVQTSGGIVLFNEYLIRYGNKGLIHWSDLKDPFKWQNTSYLPIASQKILSQKISLNSLFFWANDTSFVEVRPDPTAVFIYVLRGNTTLLSPRAIVSGRNNAFYWIGIGGFYVWNGVVSQLENNFNKLFFFNNLNTTIKGKVFGQYIENFNEIWWCFPKIGSSENNASLIYNITQNSWTDNTLSRFAGVSNAITQKPIFASTKESFTEALTYPLFLHEVGWNHVEDNIAFPITAFLETNRFSLRSMGNSENKDKQMKITLLEPDVLMDQSANIEITINNYSFNNTLPIENFYQNYKFNQGGLGWNVNCQNASIVIQSNNLNSWFQTGKHRVWYVPTSIQQARIQSNTPAV